MDFIPLAIPNITEAEGRNLQKCVADNFVSSVGAFVTEMESRVATLSGCEYGAAMGAGTQALHMALHCLNIGPGDLVILPSFTFIASANAVAHSGATPWLFDITADSWTIDPQQVRRALENETEVKNGVLTHKATGKRVAAIMPVYTLGTSADMSALGKIATAYNIPIIADAAAAIGVTYQGRPIAEVADLTCYSFNGNKTITCGGGGMVVGRDKKLIGDIKHVSSTARVSPAYEHDRVGYNYRMTNVQAAIGCAQLDRLDDFLSAKQRIRETYDTAFEAIEGISVFPKPHDRTSTFWFSGFVIHDAQLPKPSEFCAALREYKIEARTFWKPVHLQAPYQDAPCESQSVGTELWDKIVTLPCSTLLTPEDQKRVVNATLDILKRK